jgi:hypothetical protein
MYLLLSLVSLAGALYLIYTMMLDEGEEAVGVETADVAMPAMSVAAPDMRPPSEEGLGELIASTTAGLGNLLRGWLGRQDSNLELSD